MLGSEEDKAKFTLLDDALLVFPAADMFSSSLLLEGGEADRDRALLMDTDAAAEAAGDGVLLFSLASLS